MQQCSWDQDHQIGTGHVEMSALLLYRLNLKKFGGPSTHSPAEWLITLSGLLGYWIKYQSDTGFLELSLPMAFLL